MVSFLIFVLEPVCFSFLFFFLDFIYLFLERGREGEREGEKHQCVVASHMPHTGDLACNPGMCPDWESNWRPCGFQAGTKSTEPHQPGRAHYLIFPIYCTRLCEERLPCFSRTLFSWAAWMCLRILAVSLGLIYLGLILWVINKKWSVNLYWTDMKNDKFYFFQ